MLTAATPVSAELVFFASGRTVSVRSHEEAGDSIRLVLRNGGEIVCARALVERIGDDEVPYPEPVAVQDPPRADPRNSAPTPYGVLIDRLARRYGISARLVNAVIAVESNYQERSQSVRGAMGLMQLMPATARQYSVRNPYDPSSNVEAGIKHLKTLLGKFPLDIALAAYNAGEGAVQRYGGIPPYPETREYVARVLHLLG
jgi:soluble lytic murein transglycosylase-like protein